MNQQTIQFNDAEMQQFKIVYNMCCQIGKRPTSSLIQQFGYTPEQAQRLMYMFKVYNGNITLNSERDVVKHLKKIHGNAYKISLSDFKTSNISSVPRIAVVAGITEKPYDIYNSNNYKGKNALYRVLNVSGRKIQIETPRKPRLEYGHTKSIDGVLEINGLTQNGNVIITFDRNYCHLCNRFIIIASLRNPEFSLGKYTMLAFEGTKIYVYAAIMGTGDHVRYSGGSQRVYDYGLDPNTIKPKLDRVAQAIYQQFDCASGRYDAPNERFVLVPKTKDELEEEALYNNMEQVDENPYSDDDIIF